MGYVPVLVYSPDIYIYIYMEGWLLDITEKCMTYLTATNNVRGTWPYSIKTVPVLWLSDWYDKIAQVIIRL